MEIHKLKQNKLFLFFPDNIKFRFIIPSVIIALFMGVLLYLFVSSTISIIIENRIIPKQIKEIVEYKSAKVNSIFEKSITIGKYITSHTGINAFLKDGISQKKMDDELKNELHHIKTYFNLNRIYMASALTQDYYTEDGFLKNIDLSDVENSWFESTLTSKKGYEINIDSAILKELNLWYDGVVYDGERKVGLAGFAFDISSILERVNEIDFGEGSVARIVDRDFIIRLKNGEDSYLQKPLSMVEEFSPKTIEDIKRKIEIRGFGYGEISAQDSSYSEDRFFIVAHLESIDWHLVVDFPKKNITKDYGAIIDIVMIFSFIWTLIIWNVGYYLLDKEIAKPLSYISKLLKGYKPDKVFEIEKFKSMPKELQEIGSSFKYSSLLLESSYRDLKIFNENLESLVNNQTKELQNKLSELKYKNLELITARNEALKAVEAKSIFISGVSHELRTPLNAIINFTDMVIEDFELIVEDKQIREDSKNYLARVLHNSKQLLKLINDILDFSKLEAGKIEYEDKLIEVNELLDILHQNTFSLKVGKNIEYILEKSKERIYIKSDRRRVMQIALNLISNAIKFTEEGYVKVSTKVEKDEVHLVFEDSGRGIREDKLDEIFVPFSQVNINDQGTGLGLGIVKRYCDDLGFDIEVKSKVGEGSKFVVKIKIFNKERVKT